MQELIEEATRGGLGIDRNSMNQPTTARDVEDFCREALQQIHLLQLDLTPARYGWHARTKTLVGTPKYYYLLAGVARTLQAQWAFRTQSETPTPSHTSPPPQILEIGTFQGGSAKALAIGAPRANVVTVDITRKPLDFSAYPNVSHVVGDSLDFATQSLVLSLLAPAPLALIFIDSHHTSDHVTKNLLAYAPVYQPVLVILDDIHLNPSMDQLWSELAQTYPAFDASDLVERPCGFGVLLYEQP